MDHLFISLNDFVGLVVLAIVLLAFICWLVITRIKLLCKKLFKKRCDHRFKTDEVIDLNVDPCCTRCRMYASKIRNGRSMRFQMVSDSECKLVRS